jgi:hypothetical protein
MSWFKHPCPSLMFKQKIFLNYMSYHMKNQVKTWYRTGDERGTITEQEVRKDARGWGVRADQRVMLLLKRRTRAKAAATSCGENPFSRRFCRRLTTILRELNSVRPLSARNTST